MNPENMPNRLAGEKSPYLSRHAFNPVDWFPWGEEAFAKAKREDKPVFLSVGYSTCHWCHVMERETFSDYRVAELLNHHFVSVKVDREERPDVDSVYMSVCQALTGAGGWPLTILMTPDKKPFYAGTYLSRDDMSRLINHMNDMWVHSRNDLIEAGEAIERHINLTADGVVTLPQNSEPGTLGGDAVMKAIETFSANYDERYGGFGSAPKFPSAHNLLFLLSYYRFISAGNDRDKTDDCYKMLMNTLSSMYRGGIFDHIAGGFSRYSTDEKWLVPHFEKMLYDNALLAWCYLEAFGLFGGKAEFCKTAAQKIFSWAFAELRHENGGFFCGQDADSDGEEGKYYLFDYDEVTRILGEKAENYRKYYGMSKKGNYEGRNIPNMIKNARFAETGTDESEFINDCNQAIYQYRRERTELHTDSKILTSWNSLMIVALVRAYKILGDGSYLDAAKKAECFISENLTFGGRLYVRWCDGEIFGNGKLDDYADYSLALLHLYKATGNNDYLKKAEHYADVMVQRFFDFTPVTSGGGGFFLYADDDEQLISRPKEMYDGALPSGNAVAFMVLSMLKDYTGSPKWHELYKAQEEFIASYTEYYPTGSAFSLITVLNNSKNCNGGICQ